MTRRLMTDEQETLMKELVPGRTAEELTDAVNEMLDTDFTISQITALKARRKWKSGVDRTFKKGEKAWNKGMKGLNLGGDAGWFKKGNKPPQYLPIGTEKVTKDGYIKVKIAHPSTWDMKQRLVWEKYHGEIPDGHVIIFKDKDIKNLDIDNLLMVSRQQLAVMNKKGLLTGDKSLVASAVELSNLIMATTEAERKL